MWRAWYLTRIHVSEKAGQALSQFECLDCFFNSLASVSSQRGRTINGSEGPLNYSTRRSFSRWAEKTQMKGWHWRVFQRKVKKRRKTLLHGFHFHYEKHNWRNLTAQGKKRKKNKESAAVAVRVKRRKGGGQEIMKTSLISADPPTLVRRAIVEAITNSAAAMSLKMPDCVNFPTRCHAEIIGRAARRESAGKKKTKKTKQNEGRMRSHAAAAGEISRRFAQSNQFDWAEWQDFLDSRAEATTASPCCWWAHCAFDIYRHTYEKKKKPASVIKHREDKNVSSNESQNENVMRMSTRFFVVPEPNELSSVLDFAPGLCLLAEFRTDRMYI